MIPGEGRLPASKVKELLVKKLDSFGVNIKTDTIVGTLDGCTTNIKLGKDLKKRIQLCLAHGFQLGIVKTVYILPRDNKFESVEDVTDMEQNDAEDEIIESDEELSEFEDDSDSEDEIVDEEDEEYETRNETGLYEEEPEEALELNYAYDKVIKKMRKIINRYSGRSTPRSDALQAAIKEWQKQNVSRHTIHQTLFGG